VRRPQPPEALACHHERLNGLGGAVPAPVEAPIDSVLDASAGRLEQGGHGQGGGGYRPARRRAAESAEQLSQDQHRAGVEGAEQGGEQPKTRVRLMSRSMSYN
jgi:hypothetical protein